MKEERSSITVKMYCEKYLNTAIGKILLGELLEAPCLKGLKPRLVVRSLDGMTEAVKEAWKDLTKFRRGEAKERILIQMLVIDFEEEAGADRYLQAFLSETENLANESGSVECGEGGNLMTRYYLLRGGKSCAVVFIVGFRGGPESVASSIDKSLSPELRHPDARRLLKSKDVLKALEGFRRGRTCSGLVCRVLGSLASTVNPCVNHMIRESRLCNYCFK